MASSMPALGPSPGSTSRIPHDFLEFMLWMPSVFRLPDSALFVRLPSWASTTEHLARKQSKAPRAVSPGCGRRHGLCRRIPCLVLSIWLLTTSSPERALTPATLQVETSCVRHWTVRRLGIWRAPEQPLSGLTQRDAAKRNHIEQTNGTTSPLGHHSYLK